MRWNVADLNCSLCALSFSNIRGRHTGILKRSSLPNGQKFDMHTRTLACDIASPYTLSPLCVP